MCNFGKGGRGQQKEIGYTNNLNKNLNGREIVCQMKRYGEMRIAEVILYVVVDMLSTRDVVMHWGW